MTGCLAVDVDRRNAPFIFYCWFHNNADDLFSTFEYPGVDAMVKASSCSSQFFRFFLRSGKLSENLKNVAIIVEQIFEVWAMIELKLLIFKWELLKNVLSPEKLVFVLKKITSLYYNI